MKIIMIGTVAASFLGFRSDLIRFLIEKEHSVYAFTSEYSSDELKKIDKFKSEGKI